MRWLGLLLVACCGGEVSEEALLDIEPGTFVGCDVNECWKLSTQPFVPAFHISAEPISAFSYRVCVEAKVCANPAVSGVEPATVTWSDAVSFCTWTKRQIPTEVQWEKFARRRHPARSEWVHERHTVSLVERSHQGEHFEYVLRTDETPYLQAPFRCVVPR